MLPEREETREKRRRDGRRGELCTLPRGMAGQVSDADGGRHRDGYGVAQVFVDEDMEDGEGMVNVLAWAHRKTFTPIRCTEDMQDGRGCFKATRTSVAWVEQHYPQAKGYVTATNMRRRKRTTGRRRKETPGDAAGILVQAIRRGDEADARSHGSGRGAGAAVQHGNGLWRGADVSRRAVCARRNIRSCSTNTATRGESRSARG